MDGISPQSDIRRLRATARLRALLAAMVAGASVVASVHARAEADYVIRFAENDLGQLPPAFEGAEPAAAAQASWTVVRDPSSTAEFALEQASHGLPDDAHPIAVYGAAVLKDLDVRVHFKIVSGRMKNAGIALRYQDPGNYYVVVACALEQRIDLYRAVNGEVRASRHPSRWTTGKSCASLRRATTLRSFSTVPTTSWPLTRQSRIVAGLPYGPRKTM